MTHVVRSDHDSELDLLPRAVHARHQACGIGPPRRMLLRIPVFIAADTMLPIGPGLTVAADGPWAACV